MDGQVLSWKSQTLGELLERQARERGGAEALVTPAGRFSFNQILERSKQVAGGLQAMGIRRGDHVGILMGNDEKWLSLFYGAALIGAVTVPVNTRFKAAEIEFCLKQAECKALFYAERFLGIDFESMVSSFSNAHKGLPCGRFTAVPVQAEEILLIQFTSGTTAYPKGVMLTHDSMLRDAWAAGSRIGIRADDRYFNCRPFFHVAGSTLSVLMALVAGSCLVTLPTFEAGAALELMERERCTLKDVFRVGGENVAPAEVEEVLLAHPAVEVAQVIGVPDARLGEVPCAYVTLKGAATEKELLEWCKARSANFRVPRYLKIVADFESIGMTASGKVQKTKLREHALKELKLS